MARGYLVFVLHAHLPYVLSHGTWPHGSEWLCEAACETYVPLLNLLGRLGGEGKQANLTIGLTPILCEMLASKIFKNEFKNYTERKREAARTDRLSFESVRDDRMASLAARWESFYARSFGDFTEKYGQDLIGAFRRFQDEGQIEIITSAASHGYLPLLSLDSSVSAQIRQGIETYRKHFLTEPQGMWLPECAYRPGTSVAGDAGDKPGRGRKGLEAFLAENGIRYFFTDGHLLQNGRSPVRYAKRDHQNPLIRDGAITEAAYQQRTARENAANRRARSVYTPYLTGTAEGGRCNFFCRDAETSLQVWSGEWGYPGDPYYLEFHKKHSPGGSRYWRVTDRDAGLGGKLAYEPERAADRVRVHADHFKGLVQEKLDRYFRKTGKPGIMTVLFDAELFGHWWFEGIDWLYTLISAFDENYVTIRGSAALDHAAPLKTISLPEGSWGEGGRHLIWHNARTAWTWEQIYQAEKEMAEELRQHREDDAMAARILKQMARELFLLQSSDWQFLITVGTAGDYAESRFTGHHKAFTDLRRILRGYRKEKALSEADRRVLYAREAEDAVFDNVELEWFQERIRDGL